MSELPRIILKSGKDQSLKRYHPWVFSGAIKKTQGEFEEGDWVEVYNNKDEFLALGHYQQSSIALRVMSFEKELNIQTLYRERIQQAFELRAKLGIINSSHTNVFRLINAEGDGLPGLIIDYYDGDLVIQMHSVGMWKDFQIILDSLTGLKGLEVNRIYNKSASTLPFKAQVEIEDGFVFGEEKKSDNIVIENGCKFYVDFIGGQKTGFFIDQRNNRNLLKSYSEGKRVLNMFGYTGGFSVFALKGGASSVHTVDSSAKATELADKNIQLNFPGNSNHVSFARDAMDFFSNPPEKYDVIVLDPPAYAKHHNVLSNALQGYKKINRRAFEIIEPGGILFTFSCSQVVSKENFRKSVFTAAANTGRSIRILHQLSQPPDHPVSIYHPEGEYLKGLVLQVD
ncbi:MAG: class I SAM-dependent rRNA methyltransferase [Bacteroidales bacterium]